MRLVLQRVSSAAVTIEGTDRRAIGPGLVILAGVQAGDSEAVCDYMAAKATGLRIFDDEAGQMNRSLLDIGGGCLIVSQFTLYANAKKGRRPSFTGAAPPTVSEPLYEYFVESVRRAGVGEIQTGSFGAEMLVEINNDGPVTILLDSDEIMPAR